MVKTFVKVHFKNFLNLFLFYSLNLLAVLMFFFFFLSLFLRRLYDDLGLSFLPSHHPLHFVASHLRFALPFVGDQSAKQRA